MEGWWSQGRRVSRGRGSRQVQEPREEKGAAAEQQHEPRAEVGERVAMAIQQMTDILASLVEQRGQAPVNQPRDPEIVRA